MQSLITYILPNLDEADPNLQQRRVRFRFLTSDEYSSVAQLNVDSHLKEIKRPFLIYGFGEEEEIVATTEELEEEVSKVVVDTDSSTKDGIILHEWGSMFVH